MAGTNPRCYWGLVEVRTRPVVVTSGLAFFQQLLAAPAAAMPADHLDRWWAELADADRVGCFTSGATAFVAAGTKR